MVAFEDAGVDNTIYFHVVAGILRLQFYSTSGDAAKTISSITFEEVSATPKQISGNFEVHDITYNMPYLTATDASTEANRKITITGINQAISDTRLLTFYLPLPAVTSASAYTNYKLKVTITASDNSTFEKTLGADIHRRNITMMPALQITSWSSNAAEIRLVGSGTKDRPFQIYTAEELDLVRQAFASENPIINGQRVKGVANSKTGNTDNATHFKIVRSDITLLNETDYEALSEEDKLSHKYVYWQGGIPNFKGYMYFASSTATNGGITNESNAPLFASISSEGVVDRVYVKGTSTPSVSAAFSPMCNVNNGTMIECHNRCAVTLSSSNGLAGLCVTNNGTITGGANGAALVTAGNVAGICLTNSSGATVQGNFSLSSAVPQGANIAGIAFTNQGDVVDCQVSSNVPMNSTGNWGIIVFNNASTGVIDNCIATGTVVYTVNGSVGGICNTNSGTVKNCSNNVEIRAGDGNVGGIVATMNNAAAKVFNCRSEGTHFITGAISQADVADNCGGIVGELVKGSVKNCYNNCRVEAATNTGGIIGYLHADNEAIVENCWNGYSKNFAGLYEPGAKLGAFCFSKMQSDFASGQCNLIDTEDWTVESMLSGQVQSYKDGPLYVPLNVWVTDNDDPNNGLDYYSWTTNTTHAPYPRFITGNNPYENNKGKRSGRR